MSTDFLTSKDWNDEKPDNHLTYNVFETIEQDGQKRVVMHSLSGWERNHLFLNRGKSFDDISMISGVDTDRDTRAHCTLDIDRDGSSDLVVANGNKPQLQVFRNNIGRLSAKPNNFVALKLVGGNRSDQPSEKWSCRDGVGTLINVEAGDLKYLREMRFGEGFAGQNSTTLILGLGGNADATISIRWMSGKNQQFENISSGSLLTVFENPNESSDGSGANIETYLIESEFPEHQMASEGVLPLPEALPNRDFHLVTSMATWCSACKKQRPQLDILKKHFGDEIGLVGLPMDANDSEEMLREYMLQNKPAYEMQYGIDNIIREEFKEFVAKNRGKASLPSSVLVDTKGNVIDVWLGIPTVSEVASLINTSDAE